MMATGYTWKELDYILDSWSKQMDTTTELQNLSKYGVRYQPQVNSHQAGIQNENWS